MSEDDEAGINVHLSLSLKAALWLGDLLANLKTSPPELQAFGRGLIECANSEIGTRISSEDFSPSPNSTSTH